MIELLIDHGADINVVSKTKNSALIEAIISEFEEASELLIQKGADVNVAGEDYKSALLWAAFKGKKESFDSFKSYDSKQKHDI